MEKIRVFGAGVRAALVANLISWQFVDRFLIEGYYCDQREKGTLGPLDRPILGTVANGLKEVLGDGISAFVALGTRAASLGCAVFLELEANRIPLPTLIGTILFGCKSEASILITSSISSTYSRTQDDCVAVTV